MSSLTAPSSVHHVHLSPRRVCAALAAILAAAVVAILIASAASSGQSASLPVRAGHGSGARIGYVYSPFSRSRALACIAGSRPA